MTDQAPTLLHLETDASGDTRHTRTREDGAWSVRGGAGIVLRRVHPAKYPSEEPVLDTTPLALYAIDLGFVRSTYHGEYLAFYLGLGKALAHGARGLMARSDLEGLVNCLNGTRTSRAREVREIAEAIRPLKAQLDPFVLRWSKGTHAVRRADGTFSADTLAKIGSGVLLPAQLPPGVKFERYSWERPISRPEGA